MDAGGPMTRYERHKGSNVRFLIGTLTLLAGSLGVDMANSAVTAQSTSQCTTIPPAAHRGATGAGEENTIEGWNKTRVNNNVMVIETDIALTKDDRIVVFHDRNMKRTTGVDKLIKDVTYADLPRTVDGYEVPTFRAALEWAKRFNIRMLIEVKVPMKWGRVNDMVRAVGVERNRLTFDYQPENLPAGFSLKRVLSGVHTGIKTWPAGKPASWLTQFGDAVRTESRRADDKRRGLIDAGITGIWQKAAVGLEIDTHGLWREGVRLGSVDYIITNTAGAYNRWCQEQQ